MAAFFLIDTRKYLGNLSTSIMTPFWFLHQPRKEYIFFLEEIVILEHLLPGQHMSGCLREKCHLQRHTIILCSISILCMADFWGNQAWNLCHPLSLRGPVLGCNHSFTFTGRKQRKESQHPYYTMHCALLYIYIYVTSWPS